MSDTAENGQVNPRHRLVYIRQRLVELREERERLMKEMQWLRSELGVGEAKDPKRAPQAAGRA